MRFSFKKELYPKTVLLKAAFNFTDKAYIHLDCDEENYYTEITLKNGCAITEQDFLNEMLIQATRYQIAKDTKTIRELIYARAMASTILESEHEGSIDDSEPDMTEILRDWFDERNDNKTSS